MLESHLAAGGQQALVELPQTLERLHQTFIALAAGLQIILTNMDKLKQRYLDYRYFFKYAIIIFSNIYFILMFSDAKYLVIQTTFFKRKRPKFRPRLRDQVLLPNSQISLFSPLLSFKQLKQLKIRLRKISRVFLVKRKVTPILVGYLETLRVIQDQEDFLEILLQIQRLVEVNQILKLQPENKNNKITFLNNIKN